MVRIGKQFFVAVSNTRLEAFTRSNPPQEVVITGTFSSVQEAETALKLKFPTATATDAKKSLSIGMRITWRMYRFVRQYEVEDGSLDSRFYEIFEAL